MLCPRCTHVIQPQKTLGGLGDTSVSKVLHLKSLGPDLHSHSSVQHTLGATGIHAVCCLTPLPWPFLFRLTEEFDSMRGSELLIFKHIENF